MDFPIYKFVTDAKKFAIENPVVEKKTFDEWLNNYAVKIANNVRDVVVEDVAYLTLIREHIGELWKVIVNQTRPKDGKINLSPFELLWQTKDSLDNIYGGSITKTFFMQELIDEMKDDEMETEDTFFPKIDETVELDEIELTSKVSFDTVKDEVIASVSSDYDYYKYSVEDGSNDRFMEKQKNTNSFRDTIFDTIERLDEQNNTPEPKKENNIFEFE